MSRDFPATDAEIIGAIQSGGAQRQRFENLLYRRHMDFVRKRPRKYALTPEEARDAYTDAFLVVTDHILSGKFRGDSSLKTYLSRIFRNKCVDRYRKNATIKVDWVDRFPQIADESRDFLRKLLGKEEVGILRGYLAQLGERCRQLLEFSGLGYSPTEIAQEMGFSTARSASSQRYKCLEKLKALRNTSPKTTHTPMDTPTDI